MKIKNEISISISTFYKLIPNNIIKSKKQTDMCNICNLEKSLEKQIEQNTKTGLQVPKPIENNLQTIKQHKEF